MNTPTVTTDSDRIRSQLTVMLAIYFPALAAVCLGAAALGIVMIVAGSIRPSFVSIFLIVPGVGLLWMLVDVGRALLYISEPIDLTDDMEILIPDEWIPGLWELVYEVSKTHGLPKPDEIRLHARTVAHVYEDDDGKHILVVGGLSLASFSKKALAGVIAHELGHFAAGDTMLGRKSAKRLRLMDVLDAVFEDSSTAFFNPLVWGLRGYHHWFRKTWAANSQAAEFDADRFEIEHVGPEQCARTTILTSAIDYLPASELHAVAESCVTLRIPMTQLFTTQAQRARATTPDEWEDAFRKAARVRTKPLDSHPCMKERLKATGLTKGQCLKIARSMNQDEDPAAELVHNWPAVEKVLTERLMDIIEDMHEAKMEFAQIVLGRYGSGPSIGSMIDVHSL